MLETDSIGLPKTIDGLSVWFAEAVQDEIHALSKDGDKKQYEVHSGKLLEVIDSNKAVFQFILADETRLPEDSNCKLKTETEEYEASILSQIGDRIQILVTFTDKTPPGIYRGVLVVDNTELLRKLNECLLAVSDNSLSLTDIAIKIFHPKEAHVGSSNLKSPTSRSLEENLKRIIEQSCGSSITYIWGPPGTGKTFCIAHLIVELIESGERVLVSSHTNAAVDQVIYATVKGIDKPKDKAGPLCNNPLVYDGKIVRIGKTTDRNIPGEVKFDEILEKRAKQYQDEIFSIEEKVKTLKIKFTEYQTFINAWKELSEITIHYQDLIKRIDVKNEQLSDLSKKLEGIRKILQNKRNNLEIAKKAWIFKSKKVRNATVDFQITEEFLLKEECKQTPLEEELDKLTAEKNTIEKILSHKRLLCEKLPPQAELENETERVKSQLQEFDKEITLLREKISALEKELISEARVIFCTLTKNYMANLLEGQKFDAVIVDEISMALPPLIFLAGGKATRRAILVGDFCQLPPIVKSDSEISKTRLGTDIFHLSRLVSNLEPEEDSKQLARLRVQRRIIPQIAAVARHLAYKQTGIFLDHDEVRKRTVPEWLNFISDSPLIIIDTADLHCWCGKQPGTLSRFNIYSANIAVEIAAMAASLIPRPHVESSVPIGIVTPYSAQRKLTVHLVKQLKLNDWIMAGTVHTFQGNEAELIIFDSVLDEPYWSARLCNPRNRGDVIRDLNVAVTRTRNKFIFVGSSEWLNNHARTHSGLGDLWNYIKDNAELIPAHEVIDSKFDNLLRQNESKENYWTIPVDQDQYIHQILDETSFFDVFTHDIDSATYTIFGLAPFFGEYRWARLEPHIRSALNRGVEVTLVTPPISEVKSNPDYVGKVISNLRKQGVIVVHASGLHGKDIVFDENIHYTGSLNWTSHRGRDEIMHRTISSTFAKQVLNYMQSKYIRKSAIHDDGTPRLCPACGHLTQVVNQRRQNSAWDSQAMKVGCSNKDCFSYLRDIDERPPYIEIPRCKRDHKTKYRKVKRGRGEVWQCPKHPQDCITEKVVPGDPS